MVLVRIGVVNRVWLDISGSTIGKLEMIQPVKIVWVRFGDVDFCHTGLYGFGLKMLLSCVKYIVNMS